MSVEGTLSSMGVSRGRRRPSKLAKKKVRRGSVEEAGNRERAAQRAAKVVHDDLGLESAKALLELKTVFSLFSKRPPW